MENIISPVYTFIQRNKNERQKKRKTDRKRNFGLDQYVRIISKRIKESAH